MPKGKAKDIEAQEEMMMESAGTDNLKNKMIEVGLKLCEDLMNGKTRDEKTALTAIVEIYEAVHGM